MANGGETPSGYETMRELWQNASRIESQNARLAYIIGSLGGIAGGGFGIAIAAEGDRPAGVLMAGVSVLFAERAVHFGHKLHQSARRHKALSQAETAEELDTISALYRPRDL